MKAMDNKERANAYGELFFPLPSPNIFEQQKKKQKAIFMVSTANIAFPLYLNKMLVTGRKTNRRQAYIHIYK